MTKVITEIERYADSPRQIEKELHYGRNGIGQEVGKVSSAISQLFVAYGTIGFRPIQISH